MIQCVQICHGKKNEQQSKFLWLNFYLLVEKVLQEVQLFS